MSRTIPGAQPDSHRTVARCVELKMQRCSKDNNQFHTRTGHTGDKGFTVLLLASSAAEYVEVMTVMANCHAAQLGRLASTHFDACLAATVA